MRLLNWLIAWPERVAEHLTWLAPLFARITVGWVFLLSGWGKLHNLPQVTENFIGWEFPFRIFSRPLPRVSNSLEVCSCCWGCLLESPLAPWASR